MAKRVTVRVPTRIDLAGGWTDVPAYCRGSVGHVVNMAINRYITAEMVVDDQRLCSVSYSTDMPIGSGLGTSGAMNVALLAAIAGHNRSSLELAELAFQFEGLMGNTGGRQDQWASANGGIQYLQFQGDEVRVEQLTPSPSFTQWIETHMMLFDSGIQHVSGELHEDVWQRFERGDAAVTDALHHLAQAGEHMKTALQNESRSEFVNALRMVMAGVDGLGGHVHEPFRRPLAALEHSGDVLAWKAMGAGGGGVVGVFINDLHAQSAVRATLLNDGWTELKWELESEGIQRTVSPHE